MASMTIKTQTKNSCLCLQTIPYKSTDYLTGLHEDRMMQKVLVWNVMENSCMVQHFRPTDPRHCSTLKTIDINMKIALQSLALGRFSFKTYNVKKKIKWQDRYRKMFQGGKYNAIKAALPFELGIYFLGEKKKKEVNLIASFQFATCLWPPPDKGHLGSAWRTGGETAYCHLQSPPSLLFLERSLKESGNFPLYIFSS